MKTSSSLRLLVRGQGGKIVGIRGVSHLILTLLI